MFFVLTVVPSGLYYLVSLNRRVLAADDAQVPADPDLVLTHGGAQEGQDLGLDTGELPLGQTGLVDSLQELGCCSRSTHRSPALLRFLRLQAQTKNLSFMIQFLISEPDFASNYERFIYAKIVNSVIGRKFTGNLFLSFITQEYINFISFLTVIKKIVNSAIGRKFTGSFFNFLFFLRQ